MRKRLHVECAEVVHEGAVKRGGTDKQEMLHHAQVSIKPHQEKNHLNIMYLMLVYL